MIRRFVTLALLTLMSTLSFCQTNYPRKIKFNGDTCAIISIPQLKVINQRLLQRRYLMVENDSLRTYNFDLTRYIGIKNTQIDSLLKLNVDYRFRLRNEMDLNLKYREDKSKLENKIKRKKRLFWVGVTSSFLIGFFLAK